MTDLRRRQLLFCISIGSGLVVTLLPWWRHHGYLRDLYDYGLLIAALGRMEAGEMPYVDFTTPIQAGYFGLCRMVEVMGGGTFRALTWGGAGLTALMALALPLLLWRRWPVWAAAILGTMITAATATQHTIIWHNVLGVFALALVTWSAAIAPVLRRADWPWHGLMLVGLVAGGLNKLNFQLVAVAVAWAWAWREGCAGRAGAGRVAGTTLVVVLAGLAVPLMVELAWTGATFGNWWHNVVQLPATGRAAPLLRIWSSDFLFRPIHDYYGALLLPQAGLCGLLLSIGGLAGCWPAHGADRAARWDRVFLPLAVLLSGLAGAALLATNQDIVYVGLGAWLVLLAGIWTGFGGNGRRWRSGLGLLLPALLIGGAAWISAWQGQRSQFGYSSAPRSAFRLATDAGPALAYLEGLRLPPEQVDTLKDIERWLPAADEAGRRPVFYGLGMEWLGRIWPAVRLTGEPLWIHWDTTYGEHERQRLLHELGTGGRYQLVLSTLARDHWPAGLGLVLNQFYLRSLLGPVTVRWVRRDGWQLQFKDGLDFVNRLGGNVAGQKLRLESLPLALMPDEPDRLMLGVTEGEGRCQLTVPSYKFGGEAVLRRLAHAGPGPMEAHFKVIEHGAIPEHVRWAQTVVLPAGEARVAVPFRLDALGKPLELRVTVAAASQGLVAAGYRNLQISHAIESPGLPPDLRIDDSQPVPAAPALVAAGFGEVAWRPAQMFVQHARPTAAGLELAAGGEFWFHTDGMLGELRGQVTSPDSAGTRPMVRTVWYKGGRLQIMQQGAVPAGGSLDVHVWCAEPGGWIGLLVDPGAGTAPAQIRLTAASFSP